jgi:hypothetical protein
MTVLTSSHKPEAKRLEIPDALYADPRVGYFTMSVIEEYVRRRNEGEPLDTRSVGHATRLDDEEVEAELQLLRTCGYLPQGDE